MANKREFIVKKPFRFNGDVYAARDRIVLTGPVSEQAEARLGFGMKWRFIVPLVSGKAATLKDENAGKSTQDDNVVHKEAPKAPAAPAAPHTGATNDGEPLAPKVPAHKGKKGK